MEGQRASFMEKFMSELRKIMVEKYAEEIYGLKYSSEEQNIDCSLKRKVKQIILNELSSFNGVKVQRVYIGKEAKENKEVKEALMRASKNSDRIWANPDLCIKFQDEQGVFYETIELKSCKKDVIYGSSINQIDFDQWVIFVRHDGKNCAISVGRYIDFVPADQKLKFDIRFRPFVSINEANKATEQARKEKEYMLNNWEQIMAEDSVDELINGTTDNLLSRWLKKFSLVLLKRFMQMSDEEKEALFQKLS